MHVVCGDSVLIWKHPHHRCYCITGEVIRDETGPTAVHTTVGWILSGPTSHLETSVNLTVASTHALKIDIWFSSDAGLDDCLKSFLDLESLGIAREEPSVYEKFIQKIRFNGCRYEVCLPWKECHPPLLDHYELCHKRSLSLLKRLKQPPQLLQEYHSIIQDQIEKEIAEIVHTCFMNNDRIHYLPYHALLRQDHALLCQDKSTSRLRIVYDVSARSTGPSLNDCLYIDPKFGQSIFDILIHFKLHKIASLETSRKHFSCCQFRKQTETHSDSFG